MEVYQIANSGYVSLRWEEKEKRQEKLGETGTDVWRGKKLIIYSFLYLIVQKRADGLGFSTEEDDDVTFLASFFLACFFFFSVFVFRTFFSAN